MINKYLKPLYKNLTSFYLNRTIGELAKDISFTPQFEDSVKRIIDEAPGEGGEGIVGEATVSTTPVDTTSAFKRYLVSAPGTYNNFGGIVVSPGDLNSGLVQLWGENNIWTKKIIATDTSALVTSVGVLKDEVYTLEDIPITIVSNGYLNKTTGAVVSNADRNYSFVDVSPGDEVYVTAFLFGDSTALAVYFNGDTFISSEKPGNNTAEQALVNYKLTIPVGTTKVGITNRWYFQNYRKAFFVRKKSTQKIGQKINILSEFTKDLSTKKILILGDSITEGGSWTYAPWPGVFGGLLNIPLSNISNYAYSGARFSFFNDTNGSETNPTQANGNRDNVIWNHINKWEATSPSAPDIIIIAAGTNEISQNPSNVGTYTNAFAAAIGSTSQLTGANALRHVLYRLQSSYPSARIFYCTPIQGVSGGRNYSNLRSLSDEYTLICKRMGVAVIDCNAGSGINVEWEVADSAGRYLYDGTHTNAAGAILMARYIANSFYALY